MTRAFHILHSHGSTAVHAESAAEAVRQALIPAGFRDALAVIDASLIVRRDDSTRAFTAILGEALATERGKAG